MALTEMLNKDPEEDLPGLEDEVAERWRQLGPLSLAEIAEHGNDIDYSKDIKRYDDGSAPIYIGQLNSDNDCDGICRKVFDTDIYEGQFKDDELNGYGRKISEYCYEIGQFKNGKLHGKGKKVDFDSGNVCGYTSSEEDTIYLG